MVLPMLEDDDVMCDICEENIALGECDDGICRCKQCCLNDGFDPLTGEDLGFEEEDEVE